MSNDDKKPGRSIGARMGIAAVILSVSMLLSRILGFLREAVIAFLHGATAATDAYYAAFTLPDLLAYFLAGGTLSITFIPLFSSYISKGDEEGGWRLFSTVATTMGVLLVVFTVVAEIFAPQIVPVLFPGFDDPDQLELAIRMTQIVIPAQLAFYGGGLLSATLFVRETFWPAAVAPLVYNVCIIAGGVLLNPWLGIQGFAVGVVIGAFLGPLGVPLYASRKRIKFTPRFAPTDPGFKQFLWLTLPLMLGVSLVTVDEWLLKYFGSAQAEGAISWLTNGRKLMLMAFAMIGQAAGQAALPFLTRLYHENKLDEMGEMLAVSIQRVLFLSILAAAGLAALAEPLVFVIFRRGAFSAEAAASTAQVLQFFAIGLPAWATQAMAARGFYARKDTISPMVIGTSVVMCSIPVYIYLNGAYGVVGLAASTSIGMSLNAIATLVVYRVRYGHIQLGQPARGAARGILAGLLAGLPAYFAAAHFFEPHMLEAFIALVVSGLAFCGIVVVLAVVARPPELEVVQRKIRAKLGR